MNLFHFLQLIRWKNLFIVVYIFLILEFILFPAFSISGKLNLIQFIVLLLAVLFIMSAGYVINDIFDTASDKINKKNNLISTIISSDKARRIYLFLNSIGIFMGVLLCLKLKQPNMAFIFFGAPLLLYLYSKKYKSKPLIGNIIISFLVAFSAIILIVFNVDLFKVINNNIFLTYLTIALFAFAFLVNFIREICKDIEDVKGDYSQNMQTLPILLGRNRAKNLSLFLMFSLAIGIAFSCIVITETFRLTALYLVLVVLPSILITFYKLKNAKTQAHFKKINTYLKVIMFLGINSLIILSLQSNVL